MVNRIPTDMIEDRTSGQKLSEQLADNTTLIKNISVDVTDKQFGAKGDGIADDTVAIQNAINYVQNLNINNVLYSNGSNGTLFAKKVKLPMGKYKITSPLVINATNKTQTSDTSNTISGVTLEGDGITSTVIDASSMTSGDALSVLGGFTKVADLQILNAKNHGINSNGWGNVFERIYVNNPAKDGIYISGGFKLAISKCLVFDAGGYGFSFNDYHTSCLVENNYALQCTLGGYFVGNQTDITLSKGMTYSTFNANASDGGANAYTFAGCRALSVNGCGCEVVSNRAIYISGTDSSVSINGFIADRVGGNGVYVEGNRVQVTITNFTDSNPTNVATPLIAGGGTDAKINLSNITNKRTYLYDASVSADVQLMNKKKHTTITFDVNNKTIATMAHLSGYNTNYGGQIIVRAFSGSSVSPNTSLNTATYILNVDKGAGGSNVTTIASTGLKGDSTASQGWPSFTFTMTGDSLIATHTNTSAWASRSFSFVVETVGEIKAV